ncbi:MAG: hypothetical protein ACK4IC_05220 [Erythrobacter sp.]
MDRFQHLGDSVSDPARKAAPLTPSATETLTEIPKAIYVGTGGHIRLKCIDDVTPVSFRNVVSGTILPVRAAQVMIEGTTATDLVALF